MPFQPDILITTPDGIALVVDAKITLPNLERTEKDLKEYMFQMQCPTGLLITQWLEDLAKRPTKDLPNDLREALRDYILPAVTSSNVRAAHPRYS